MLRCLLAALALMVLPLWDRDCLLAGKSRPFVSLILSKATAERRPRDILFHCEVVLDNATGRDLTVRSNFFSVCDGLELVVTTRDGTVLAQQSYLSHQSPYSPERRKFLLKSKRTGATLVFPISDLPRDAQQLKIRLVGTLPGSGYERLLSSETVEVRIPK